MTAAVALAGLALAACGSDDDDGSSVSIADVETTDAPSDSTAAATSSPTGDTSSVEAVTIEHKFGETTIDGVPQRIVSISDQWTDVLTSLGHAPIAATSDATYGGWFPWQETGGIEEIPLSDTSIPFEAIAAFDPDLIVGSFRVVDESDYQLLSDIAPTLPLLAGDRQVDQWQDLATAAGEFLGDPDAATELIADVQQRSTDLSAELPGLEDKTYAFANYVASGNSIYVVADPDDGASQLFAQLGIEIDPDLLAMDGADTGRLQLSLERIGDLDADILMILLNGTDTADIVGWTELPAVQSGAVVIMSYEDAVGLNTPSPLSVAYLLENIRPALEVAADES